MAVRGKVMTMLDSDDLNKLLVAATTGKGLENSGVPVTPESEVAYAEIVAELEAAPEGVMVSPVFDWPGNEYDDLIAATDRAWGGDKSLEELANEENKAQNQSADPEEPPKP